MSAPNPKPVDYDALKRRMRAQAHRNYRITTGDYNANGEALLDGADAIETLVRQKREAKEIPYD
jgi:hypothetical protein